MRVVFMGTPDFAVPALMALIENHEVICVYTQAPKEAGRGQKIQKSAVHVLAESHGIEVRTPRTLRLEEEQDLYRALGADVCVVAAYGLILPDAILAPWPCINIHGSLLPRWRGAAPIQRAIEAGDEKTGITIMEMVKALDAGKMYLKQEIRIDENATGGSLHDEMAPIGAGLIVKYLADMNEIEGEVQDESLVTYAHKIEKEECKIDFSMYGGDLALKIRAFNPYPAMYFEYNGERFKVFKAGFVNEKHEYPHGTIVNGKTALTFAVKDGFLSVKEIQRQGKKLVPVEEFLNGFSFS